MAVGFEKVSTDRDQRRLAELAAEIWNEYWPALIGQAQTDYMVETGQSLDAIRDDMSHHGYEYWFVTDEEGVVIGYAGGCVEALTNRYFISKVYLLEAERGKGYSSEILCFFERLCHSRGLGAMYLRVYRFNELGIRAYEANGFEVIDEVKKELGGGFILDDLVMEKRFAV